MKHIKKILFILLIMIAILTIFFSFTKKETNPETNNTSSNITHSSDNKSDKNKSNFNGENAVIYLGTHSQYEPVTVALEMPDSKEKLAEVIILKISNLIGYNIEINSIKFEDKNIYIDLSNEYAPFNIENSILETEEKLYSLYGIENIIFTIFDSIAKTLESYFGTEYNIYFSTDTQNINISRGNFNFQIISSIPYKINE